VPSLNARQVFRVYDLSVDGDVRTIQREAPGFWQRFTGTFSDDDGSTITGYWERSEDGSEWRRDFDLTHTRV
jgi:phenylpropionate dioxygenase-like ring-hydroxylating dioxygenase large terminal subunit